MYTYTYIHIYIYIYVYIHSHTRTHMFTDIPTCTYIQTHTDINTCIYIYNHFTSTNISNELLNDMGGRGGYCFDNRHPKLDLHGKLMTYYLLPTILLPINNNSYYPPQG